MNYEKKPWGFELVWANTENYSGRVFIIKQGEATAFSYHKTRDKTIFVLQGIVNMVLENRTKKISRNYKKFPARTCHLLYYLASHWFGTRNSRWLWKFNILGGCVKPDLPGSCLDWSMDVCRAYQRHRRHED